MTSLWKDKDGSAYLWAVFIILALVMLAAVVYNGVDVYAQYQSAETELERAATVTVDGSMANAAVRDLVLDVPPADAEELFFEHLQSLGYERGGADWTKHVDGKAQYTLTGLAVTVNGRTMTASAVLAVPLLWKTSTFATVRIPIQARSAVLYIG